MRLPERVRKKLDELPDKPGVYVMRDRGGRVIYVGKALSLRDRVRSYFRRSTLRSAEPKLRGLIHSIRDLDTIVCRSEAEAVLTEGRFIKDYKPRYNVDFRDDKRFLLLRVNPADPCPRFKTTRIEKGDGATWFGPYVNSAAARAALDFIERKFGLRSCRPAVPGPQDYKHCSNDIIRYCSAPCVGKVTPEEYRARIEEACAFLRGEKPEILKEMRAAMEAESAAMNYEKAAALRDMLRLLGEAVKRRIRAEKTIEVKVEEARAGVAELERALGLAAPPAVIEAFDVSNISGTHAVASMVCCVDGMPHRNRYRLFRIRTVEGSDDPAMMAEAIRRRYGRVLAEKGPLPGLVLVDGGLTQVRAARAELDALGLERVPVAGLAKRFEEIVWEPREERSSTSTRTRTRTIRLPEDAPALKVLQQIRDEAHRFALTYHRKLRARRIRESVLDEVPGIGPNRKRLLLAHFGSVRRMAKAGPDEIAQVPGIGPELARAIHAALRGQNG